MRNEKKSFMNCQGLLLLNVLLLLFLELMYYLFSFNKTGDKIWYFLFISGAGVSYLEHIQPQISRWSPSTWVNGKEVFVSLELT